MEVLSNGLSMALGRMITAWCEQLVPLSLERYLETGGFQGLQRAADMSSLEVVAALRAGGARGRCVGAEPVYLKWQRFRADPEPRVLVVDARCHDSRSQTSKYLFRNNPYGLLEGLLLAAQVGGGGRWVCKVMLPQDQHEYMTGLLNAWEAVKTAGFNQGMEITLELAREAAPAIYSAGREDPQVPKCSLGHRLETWYHIVLSQSLGPSRYQTLGLEGHTGSWLVTVGGAVNKPGLVEAQVGGSLWAVVETLAGGVVKEAIPLALSFDSGMGGFLPPSAAQISMAPEELDGAGVIGAPETIWILEKGACMVDAARRALYRYWLLSGGQAGPDRQLMAKSLRLVTEVVHGKGTPDHIPALLESVRFMGDAGLAAAWPLGSSMTYYRTQWEDHVHRRGCPSGYCLEKKLAPCHRSCPAGIDIPNFLAQIGKGDYKGAVHTITLDNPLPYACGLVCPAPCENTCLRAEMDSAISIRAMKAVAAKESLEGGGYPKPRRKKISGKKVAVVGSGPAGLTCAYNLAKKGHAVSIYEAQDEPGGMLRYGIPAYRLPREVLAQELESITRLGVEIKTGTGLGREFSLEDLRKEDFEAVFLGIGACLGYHLGLPGEDQCPGAVLDAISFLRGVAQGELTRPGDQVVVVGGGNAAMDAARTCLRLGCSKVTIAYRRTRAEMSAHEDEIEDALAEGVEVLYLTVPRRLVVEDGKLIGLESFRARLGKRDASGRRRPVRVVDSEFITPADTIIAAIGQKPDLECLGAMAGDDNVCSGVVLADPQTGATSLPWLFSGGDAVSGPTTVVQAVSAGKRAAEAIDAYLTGKPLDAAALKPAPRAVTDTLSASVDQRLDSHRARPAKSPVDERRQDFGLVESILTDDQAYDEAVRCLRCDQCIGCGLCQLVCSEVGAEALRLRSTEADRLAFNDFTRPATRCIGCGACAQICPTGAIAQVNRGRLLQTVLTGTVVRELELITCRSCGEPYQSGAYMNHLKNTVGSDEAAEHVGSHVCPRCSRFNRARELAGVPFCNPPGFSQ